MLDVAVPTQHNEACCSRIRPHGRRIRVDQLLALGQFVVLDVLDRLSILAPLWQDKDKDSIRAVRIDDATLFVVHFFLTSLLPT